MNGIFLRTEVYILFTLVLIKVDTSEVSVFGNSLCIFAVSSIIVLTCSTCNVQKYYFKDILQQFANVLHISAIVIKMIIS